MTTTALPLTPFRTSGGGLSSVLLALLVGLGGLALPEHTVAQSASIVSIERQQASADASVDVPIQVTDFTDIGAISLIITYDPDVVEFAEDAETRSLVAGTPRENFLANVVDPGELRISWFDSRGSSPIEIKDGTLLRITFHRYIGGESPVVFAESSEISDIEAKPVEATFQDGYVGGHP